VSRKSTSATHVEAYEKLLPFRFITAAKYAPALESSLESAMMRCLSGMEKLTGKTVLLVDVSGSMDRSLSARSEVVRMDAAAGVAILAREICEQFEMFTFSNRTVQIPARHGFALRDTIVSSQDHCGTMLGTAVNQVNSIDHDRLIVITDEQSHEVVPNPKRNGYIVNVAAYRNGVGYGAWTYIDGWSEAVLDYICEFERVD